MIDGILYIVKSPVVWGSWRGDAAEITYFVAISFIMQWGRVLEYFF